MMRQRRVEKVGHSEREERKRERENAFEAQEVMDDEDWIKDEASLLRVVE